MDRDQILAWTAAERLGLADLLERLDDHEWEVASACAGWTVRDVAAHVTTSTREGLRSTLVGIVRARGSWDRMTFDTARTLARRHSRAEIVARIRETAHSPRRAPGAGLLDPLADVLVHGQDVARPLGRVRPMPPGPTVAALEHVRASRFYGAHRRLRDTRLVATDCDWSAGEGPHELRGPVGDLLLVATGRPAGLPALSGTALERVGAAL